MNIGDIFFAIGIVILSMLLVFVVYDDIMNPYPLSIDDISEMNVTEEIISENGTTVVSIKVDNNTVNWDSSSKIKTDHVQNSNNAKIITQKLNNKNNLVQNSNSPNTNGNYLVRGSNSPNTNGNYLVRGSNSQNNNENLVQGSNSPNNNVKKDKTYSVNSKYSNYQNNPKNKVTGQNEPIK